VGLDGYPIFSGDVMDGLGNRFRDGAQVLRPAATNLRDKPQDRYRLDMDSAASG
jgi:hypothetical protein